MANKLTVNRKIVCKNIAIAHVPVIQCEEEAESAEESTTARGDRDRGQKENSNS